MGALLTSLRWPLAGLAAALLGVTFYYAYVRRPSRRNQVIAWISTAVAAAAVTVSLLRH